MTSSDSTRGDFVVRLRSIVDEVVGGHDGVYVVEIEIKGQKGSRVINVYLERDGVLTIEQLAAISREVSFVLDTEDIIAGRYYLNVSSPGADRPLKLPRQFRKHVGRMLTATRVAEAGASQEVSGELTAADDETFELKPEKGEPVRFTYQEIETARVRLPW